MIGALGNLLALDSEEASEDEQVLANGELLVERLLLMHHAELPTNARTILVWIAPKNLKGPGGTRRDASDHAHRGGLPRAVRSEEAEELAVANVKVDGVHGRPLPEGLRQTSGADQGRSVRS